MLICHANVETTLINNAFPSEKPSFETTNSVFIVLVVKRLSYFCELFIAPSTAVPTLVRTLMSMNAQAVLGPM